MVAEYFSGKWMSFPIDPEFETEFEKVMSEIPCNPDHKVDGVIPAISDLHLAGRICDCGRIIFKKELCGCGENKHYQLKPSPNE